MADLIQFTWLKRDARYSRHHFVLEAARTERVFVEKPSTGIGTFYDEAVDGVHEVGGTKKVGHWETRQHPALICWHGGPLQQYAPLKFGAALVERFVGLADDGSPDSVCQFVDDFGFLRSQPSRLGGSSETVDSILAMARDVRSLFELSSLGRKAFALALEQGASLGIPLECELVPDAEEHVPRLELRPRDLIGAIALQLGLLALGGAMFRSCRYVNCQRPFVSGPGTTLRADAEFCSKTHKDLSKSLARSRRKK